MVCSNDEDNERKSFNISQLKTKCSNIIKKYFGVSYLLLKGDVFSEK